MLKHLGHAKKNHYNDLFLYTFRVTRSEIAEAWGVGSALKKTMLGFTNLVVSLEKASWLAFGNPYHLSG